MSPSDDIKIVVIVQCAIALERCSGFNCSWAFHKRSNYFKDYMKAILLQKGFKVIEGGYESSGAQKRRENNHYKAYSLLNCEEI